MAGRGRRVKFHGAFSTKAKAVKKERSREGSHIIVRKIKGKKRYIVIS